jgi:hypothetical protein
MEDLTLEVYKRKYFEMDKPVPYNNLKIYPISVNDYYNFHSNIGVFLLEKNKDPKGISMSELDYLLYMNDFNPDMGYFYRFAEMVKLCFHVENGMYCPNCGYEISLNEMLEKMQNIKTKHPNDFVEECYSQIETCKDCEGKLLNSVRYWYDENNRAYINIKDNVLTKDDYKNIKTIICHQNILDYSDEYIDPDLDEDRKEAERIKSKNIQIPSLEKQMCCIIASSSYKNEELYLMSIRKFAMLLNTIDDKLHYQIYKLNENSGAVTFKTGIEHWIYKKKKTLLDDLVSYDAFKNKMQHVAK